MATSTNIVFYKTRGKLGPVSIRQRGGKTVLALRSGSRHSKPTERQAVAIKDFTRAVTIARALLNNPIAKDYYLNAKRPGRSAFNIAMADILKAPQVTEINASCYTGQPGSIILIKATDDFKVASVRLSIYTSNGKLVEEGNATEDTIATNWVYTCTVENYLHKGSKVIVTALDLPGNKGVLEIVL